MCRQHVPETEGGSDETLWLAASIKAKKKQEEEDDKEGEEKGINHLKSVNSGPN